MNHDDEDEALFDPLEQEALFDLPVPPRRPFRAPAGTTARRYHSDRLCSDCVADIHALGFAVAEPARRIRWAVSTGALTVHVCEQHKDRRLQKR
jgi:hypothetical protein